MKIILRQDFETLGKMGDMVIVKDGYARNFLIPRGIAVLASPKNVRALEEERKVIMRRQDKDHRVAEALSKQLEKVSLTASVAVGEEDRVFGSVTALSISDLLKEELRKVPISLKRGWVKKSLPSPESPSTVI